MTYAIPLTWEAWLVERAKNYRLFALGHPDPVQAAHYAGYMGA